MKDNKFPTDIFDKNGVLISEDDVISDGKHYFRCYWNSPTNEVAAFSPTYGYIDDTSKTNLSTFERIGTYKECAHLLEDD